MNDKDQMKIPSLKDILMNPSHIRINEPMLFEDNCEAIINEDLSVTWIEDGTRIHIKGFPTKKDAHDFCMFADFDERNNSYLEITGAKYKLTWVYE
jgi:hypothetical protein